MNIPRGREKKVMGSFSNSIYKFKKQVLKGDIIVAYQDYCNQVKRYL